ncbi:MAG: hypothetical protein JWN03_3704 [Nocardia sp.]|uniref:hypothetical protein n=1 Tax=Nocardia sp. TaxID=1821 RepID=UPI0026103B11|nr:hypothetical protein [Nocardia sp.]MCU1643429.1 hypothetical protein [Nocardia sp.]
MTALDNASIALRAKLLRESRQLIDEAVELERVREIEAARALRRRASDVKQEYTKTLPDIAVARCPETGAVVEYPIDIVDFDGWYWDSGNPWRRSPTVPKNWLTMSGAARLSEPVAFAPFRCQPGPGLPYVIPRILANEGVRAVLNQVPVGPHIGWTISYFGPRPEGVKLENTWGSNVYDIYSDDGEWLGWGEHESDVGEYDFDLAPWLESEKLLWIAPGDPEVQLNAGATGCPYIGLEGEHRKAGIFRGELRRND